jgi:hypothetical protein
VDYMLSRNLTDPNLHGSQHHKLRQADSLGSTVQTPLGASGSIGQKRTLSLEVTSPTAGATEVAANAFAAGAFALLLVEWKLKQMGSDATLPDTLSA